MRIVRRRAIVFAAGEGTRLRPLTLDRPKPMVPIGGQPILHYILTWLAEQGVDLVGVNLHYRPEVIERSVGDGSAFGLEVRYTHEPELLGSAGALRELLPVLGADDAPVVAVYGDTLTTLPLAPLLDWHERSGAALTMAVMEHPNPTEAGIVDLVGRRPWNGGVAGRVVRIVEKPKHDQVFSTIANAGIFVLDPAVASYVPRTGASDVARDLIPTLIQRSETVAGWQVPPTATVWDAGTWASYKRAQREWGPIWEMRTGAGSTGG